MLAYNRFIQLALFIIIALPFSGCNRIDNALDVVARHQSETVILAKEPVVLDTTARSFSSLSLKVIGGMSSVCLALKDDVQAGPAEVVDKEFNTAMNGTVVNVSIKLSSGQTLKLSEPMQSWSRSGKILKSNELSACASPCCEAQKKLTVGMTINEVTISASKPLKVPGIYWYSTNAFDKIGK